MVLLLALLLEIRKAGKILECRTALLTSGRQ
jgi:hypothetical protein